MNNADITSLTRQALAADCQITLTITPKGFYEQETEE